MASASGVTLSTRTWRNGADPGSPAAAGAGTEGGTIAWPTATEVAGDPIARELAAA